MDSKKRILTKDIIFALVKECSRRFEFVCFPDFDYDNKRDFFDGLMEALYGVCMLLSDDWLSDSAYLFELCCKEKEYFFGGKKSE